MQTAKLFASGRSQAVRLPKAYRFEGQVVRIRRMGRAVILLPAEDDWAGLFASLDRFSDDFMTDREQPEDQVREAAFDE